MPKDNKFDERAAGCLHPFWELPAKTQEALRVIGAPKPEKIMIHRSTALLVAAVLSKVPYAKRRDIRESVTRAVWAMVEAGEMPGQQDGAPRTVYAARCAARLFWFFDQADEDGDGSTGNLPRARRHRQDAARSSF